MHIAQPRIRRTNPCISEHLPLCSIASGRCAEENQIMKFKLVTVVLASAVALSSASASERVYRQSQHRNPYNAMNMMQAPAPAYAPSYSYGPGNSYGYAPGGSNLSGTGSPQFGGGPGDSGGGGGP
jgi:uncharacterized membrane protein YgcG